MSQIGGCLERNETSDPLFRRASVGKANRLLTIDNNKSL